MQVYKYTNFKIKNKNYINIAWRKKMSEKIEPRVKILGENNDIWIIYLAYRECYSDIPTIDVEFNELPTYEEQVFFIREKIKKGHLTPIEHITITFTIADVSRSLLAQITRHRHASFSVKSQRYSKVVNGTFDYITPAFIKKHPKTYFRYKSFMDKIAIEYNEIMDLAITESNKSERELQQDIRYILPNACTTSYVLTMNLSSLLHFFNLRLCGHASDEIRKLAEMMLTLINKKYPFLFTGIAGPNCINGKCPENSTGALCKIGKKYIINS